MAFASSHPNCLFVITPRLAIHGYLPPYGVCASHTSDPCFASLTAGSSACYVPRPDPVPAMVHSSKPRRMCSLQYSKVFYSTDVRVTCKLNCEIRDETETVVRL